MTSSALIIGAGSGLSAALARQCHAAGMAVSLAARGGAKAAAVAAETGAALHQCDASRLRMWQRCSPRWTPPPHARLVVYNPSARIRGPITELDPVATRDAIETTCFGAFLVAQQAARRMLNRGSGNIFFTGASAGVKVRQFIGVRHGKIRAARAGAIAGARVAPAEHPYRPFRDRRRHRLGAGGPAG